MKKAWRRGKIVGALLVSMVLSVSMATAGQHSNEWGKKKNKAQLGPRPSYLVEDMDDSVLKEALQQCTDGPFQRTDFSIGHRGAALQFPEHTKESYEAAARMGAGILECDVTFTSDRELVCRHSQCDLHTTTNIVDTDLAQKCSVPPEFDADGNLTNAADIKCCTSDITLEEFKSLCGKMDASNPDATTVEEYLGGTANYRTDLYATCGTVMTHAESIELFKKLGVKMTPELKSPSVEMPYDGDYTQEAYAQQMIDEYKAAGVNPKNVYAQSFDLEDVLYWINHEPRFGNQAVYLDGRYDLSDFDYTDPATWNPSMEELVAQGVNIIAPPIYMLLKIDGSGNIVPSTYAEAAKAAGLDIITWTLERSGLLKDGGGWYYQSVTENIDNDGDMYEVLDVLAKDVGILGIFSDWPATVTFYSNCMGLK
ncbi:glycerophosphodiester phosphodiesterase family protein [Desulfosarcina ovata]|uniref:glycerophosphodiester phosphodiesterase n=1 Tax=Desulfosarcina ovata subsp. ovata TaxID=2752305 RepID=A0A5K8A8V2_9BACT|nr:glycerophosphodiester phosphodiesterase family protein [Desulfosarcina ovata]BBO89072.1 glycerophosphoryl diester phosphodiesterase [Desulfosarcina ovata subsp. ovata]